MCSGESCAGKKIKGRGRGRDLFRNSCVQDLFRKSCPFLIRLVVFVVGVPFCKSMNHVTFIDNKQFLFQVFGSLIRSSFFFLSTEFRFQRNLHWW